MSTNPQQEPKPISLGWTFFFGALIIVSVLMTIPDINQPVFAYVSRVTNATAWAK